MYDPAGDYLARKRVETATILAAVMLLRYLEFNDAAESLEQAVTRVYAAGKALTPDQGGSASTREFCAAVAKRL